MDLHIANVDWWLTESHLSGCFCLFARKFSEGVGDLRVIFCNLSVQFD